MASFRYEATIEAIIELSRPPLKKTPTGSV